MEDDHYLIGAEFWANRTFQMASQAEQMKVGGLSGIHWRTFETSLTVSALAQAGWHHGQELTVEKFYSDFAVSAFGDEAGPEAAAILISLDSFVPGFGQENFPDKDYATGSDACYAGGGGHCKRRQPPTDKGSFSCCAHWASAPGQPGSDPTLYTYSDRFSALRPKVPADKLEVFDHWNGLLLYTKLLAATQEAVIKLKRELTVEAAAVASAAYTKMLTALQGFVHTQGSLGLVTQHENMNWAANLGPPLQQLAKKLGHPVPESALPSRLFHGAPRIFCLTTRTLLSKWEGRLNLPLIVQADAVRMPSSITVLWRPLSDLTSHPKSLTVRRTSAARGWFNCSLPADDDLEWWAEVPSLTLRYPRAANSSVVVVVDGVSLKLDDGAAPKCLQPPCPPNEPPLWKGYGATVLVNPLKGLPELPKVHHMSGTYTEWTYNSSFNDDLLFDLTRITGAVPLELGYYEKTGDPVQLDRTYQRVLGAVSACARVNKLGGRQAVITMNWDPWLWRFKQRDPSSTLREADELLFYEQQAVAYNQLIERANKKVGGSVSIGAVVIDSEQFIWDGYPDAIPTAEYWAAVARKNALMWNATRRLYPAVAPSNISFFSRGGVHLRPDLNATACERGRGAVLRNLQIPPTYCMGTDVALDPAFDKASPFTVPLYSIGEPETTRQDFIRTADAAKRFGVIDGAVLPYIALGTGHRRALRSFPSSPGQVPPHPHCPESEYLQPNSGCFFDPAVSKLHSCLCFAPSCENDPGQNSVR